MMSLYKFATIFQVIVLVVFGILWVRMASRLKRE